MPKIMLLTVFTAIYMLVDFAFSAEPSFNVTSYLSNPNSGTSNDSVSLLQALDEYLIESSYYGEWSSSVSLSQFQFENHKGFLQLSFSSEPSLDSGPIFQQVIYFYFYDGPYIDQNSIRFCLDENRSSPLINLDNATVTYTGLPLIIRQTSINTNEYLVDLSLYFIDLVSGKPFNISSRPPGDKLGLQISLSSNDNGGLQLSSSISMLSDSLVDSQLLIYGAILYFFAFVEAAVCLTLYGALKKKPLLVLDVCLGTLYFLTVHDIYLLSSHIYLSSFLGAKIARPLIQGLGIAYGAVVVFFNLPLLLEAKAKIIKLQWKDIGRKLEKCSTIGLLLSFIAVVLAFAAIIFQQKLAFYALFAFFPLPHIIQNFMIARKFKFNSLYLGALVLPKLLFFVYIEGYAQNIFRTAPNVYACIAVLSVIAFQYIALFVQSKWPRFWFGVEQVYKISQVQKDNSQNCPICLQDFFNQEAKTDLEASLLVKDDKSQYTIITPCQHEFHLTCLKIWMGHKSECPYCRGVLPLSYQLDDERNISEGLTS